MVDKNYFEKVFSQKKNSVFRYDRGIMEDILNLKSSGKVLDLGCGEGGLSLDLAMKGFEVTCVDISKTAIDRINAEAVGRGVKINAICEDLEDYEIDGDYDFILLCGVLHFLDNKVFAFLENVRRHTCVGGVNIIDSFRDSNLPKGKIEEIYSDWEILKKEEYVWKREDFARMVYLIVERNS